MKEKTPKEFLKINIIKVLNFPKGSNISTFGIL